MDRRDFIKKLTAGTAGAAAVSCAPVDGGKLIPYLVPPDDIIPGVPNWYATACRECPAGCGVLARVREGRVVKLEGNPEHPESRGALCPRGQAGLQGLYDPDRITGPLLRVDGELQPTDWETATARLRELIGDGPVGWIGHHVTGTLDALVDEVLDARPGSRRVRFETLGYSASITAWDRLIGQAVVPSVDLSETDLIVTFGADFLETWLGTVSMTRGFAAARQVQEGDRCRFVQISPRRGLTGDNADDWFSVEPGHEAVVAAALAAEVIAALGDNLDPDLRAVALAWVDGIDPQMAATAAGLDPAQLRTLAGELVAATNPVVLGGGHALSTAAATDVETAAGLLDLVLGAAGRTVFPDRPLPLSALSSHAELLEVLDMAKGGELGALLLHHTNPVHALPLDAGAREALEAVPVISFSTLLDDSTMLADLVLPDHSPLEAWGDHEISGGRVVLQQPAMQPLHDTRATGDLLLALRGDSNETMQQAVRRRWNTLHAASGVGGSANSFWQASQRNGGYFAATANATDTELNVPAGQPTLLPPQEPLASSVAPLQGPADGFPLLVFPTIQLHDGRGANRGWLQELPDPVTKVTWDSWLELHPDTAAGLGLRDGDGVQVDSDNGSFETIAVLRSGVRRGVVGVPLGNGHTSLGRLAAGRGVNPVATLPLVLDVASGSLARATTRVRLQRTEPRRQTRTQLETHDHEREIARFVTLPATAVAVAHHENSGFYPEHEHPERRWGMSIDLNACVGCGACEVACSAENNIAVVGPTAIAEGREMSWIRIDRFESDDGTAFVPILCQHCHNAPCETVCPVNATYHTEDALNAMVYNRCVGTRYCSNNCPYKVRRFNWKATEWREPLDLQLNPDVTPRSVGVMEKCSFCVQRIREGERDARLDERDLVDGDITTACAQTCPAGAIRFGDMNDQTSEVAVAQRDERAYTLFEELNTRPAISYLARTRLPTSTPSEEEV